MVSLPLILREKVDGWDSGEHSRGAFWAVVYKEFIHMRVTNLLDYNDSDVGPEKEAIFD